MTIASISPHQSQSNTPEKIIRQNTDKTEQNTFDAKQTAGTFKLNT